MQVRISYILSCVMLLLAFTSCDIHEFPKENTEVAPFILHLNFDTELPLYKTIDYTRGENNTITGTPKHDIRYIINAYRTDNIIGENRLSDTTFVFTKSDISNLNYTAQLHLKTGVYTFRVWADYVEPGSKKDKYYDTSDFAEIVLVDRDNHSGSNDYRDAFKGSISAEVKEIKPNGGAIEIDNEATIEMRRPMGKFHFIATDGEEFVSRIAQELSEQGELVTPNSAQPAYEQLLQSIDISQFNIVFRYNAFMPCSFNIFTDKPADSWTRVQFSSRMQSEPNKDMTLGYDYIFVNDETSISISVEVYSKDGELMTSTEPINVPIARSKLTLIRGHFLTPSSSSAEGGTIINPGYDGDDYNVPI